MATIGDQMKFKEKEKEVSLSGGQHKPQTPQTLEKQQGTATKTVSRFKFLKEIVDSIRVKVSFNKSQEARDASLAEKKELVSSMAGAMFDNITNLRAYQMMSKEEAEIYAADLVALERATSRILDNDDPIIKESGIIAYADALIRTCPALRGWVKSTMSDLVHAGFLMKLPSGGHRIFGVNYEIHSAYAENAQVKKVAHSLQELVDRTMADERERFSSRLAELKAEVVSQSPSPLTVAELQDGKTGRILLTVPDLKFPVKSHFLLVESDGHSVSALGAAGAIEEVVERVISAGAMVSVDQLKKERINLKERVDDNLFKAIITLHSMIRRAIALVEEKEAEAARVAEDRAETDTERQKLAGRATVSEAEFYLDGKPGILFYDFGSQVFELKIMGQDGKITGKRPFRQVIALIERNNLHQIRVTACPERLDELFAGHREFAEEGDKFSGLGVLCALLRIGWSKTQSGLSDEEKKVRREAWEKIQAAKRVVREAEARADAERMAAGTGEDISGADIPVDPNDIKD